MSRVGPPAALLLYYFSPATGRQIRVVVRADLSAAQSRFLQDRGGGAIRAEALDYAVSPYTLPIPDSFIELDQALAKAEQKGFQRECAGVNVHYGCGRVVRAELHTYWIGQGTGTPVWTFQFGQDANARTITRQVNAITGDLITVQERGNRGGGHPQAVPPFSSLSVRVQLSEEKNAPSVAAVREGQDFWVSLTAQINSPVVDPVACLIFVVRSTGQELKRDCQEPGLSVQAGAGTLNFRTQAALRFGPSQSTAVLDITGMLTANGITQEVHTTVQVNR
jgi:hypothetical protein